MKHVIKHDLSPEMAKKVAVQAAEHYTEKFAKYDARVDWSSDTHATITFNVKGVNAAADIELQAGQIEADMNVPLLLRPFKKMALTAVEHTFQKWIDRANKGEIA